MAEEAPDHNNIPDLIPASMLNEFAYCPRRCYIEWTEGEFVDCEANAEGRFLHRRMESEVEKLSDEDLSPILAREVSFSGSEAGITCRIDLLIGDSTAVIPVDYKRGIAPDVTNVRKPTRVVLW
jgi:CRISP-associated protein Cas1